MLFVQSLTYSLSQQDDGTCASMHSRLTCLSPKSSYQTNTSECYWDSSSQSCHFVQPSNSFKITLFVAILCALISTPLALCNEYLLFTILSAPEVSMAKFKNKIVAASDKIKNRKKKMLNDAINVVAAASVDHQQGKDVSSDNIAAEITNREWSKFVKSMKRYYQSIVTPNDRIEFRSKSSYYFIISLVK